MSPAPITHHDDDAETAAFIEAVQEGIADADAGHTVPYSAVREWLLSWGTEHKKPPPNCE
ncbi:CopG family transcriptional regulator [Acetobacter fabarum]|jgi:predicted transcriptional regulator|uniref:CopG family transcriptional regulator n=1 Tax=Acetobacteraceae TaxID=433 RepID=UPI00312BA773